MADDPFSVSVLCPVLVSVIVCGVLEELISTVPNERERGESDAVGGVRPVPERLTVCGLVGSESVIVTEPLMVVAKGGVKVVVTVQLFPAPSELPQLLLLMEKLLLAAMLVIDMLVLPLFLMVKVCPLLVVFCCVSGKVMRLVER